MFQYVSSLCSIAQLVDRLGVDTFDDNTRGWFLQNPARRWTGTCKAIKYVRNKCRSPGRGSSRPLQHSLMYGPSSTLFSSVNTSLKCDAKVSMSLISIHVLLLKLQVIQRLKLFQNVDFFLQERREKPQFRLARIMCYSASLFMQVQEAIVMNNYDLGFGQSNIAFRYMYKCKALHYRKRNCFDTKQ